MKLPAVVDARRRRRTGVMIERIMSDCESCHLSLSLGVPAVSLRCCQLCWLLWTEVPPAVAGHRARVGRQPVLSIPGP